MNSILHWQILLSFIAAPLAVGYAIVRFRQDALKMDRLPYFLRILGLFVSYKIATFVLATSEAASSSMFATLLPALLYLIGISIAIYWTIDRLNDAGIGKFQALAVAIPIVGWLFVVFLFFKRGKLVEPVPD